MDFKGGMKKQIGSQTKSITAQNTEEHGGHWGGTPEGKCKTVELLEPQVLGKDGGVQLLLHDLPCLAQRLGIV